MEDSIFDDNLVQPADDVIKESPREGAEDVGSRGTSRYAAGDAVAEPRASEERAAERAAHGARARHGVEPHEPGRLVPPAEKTDVDTHQRREPASGGNSKTTAGRRRVGRVTTEAFSCGTSGP